MHHLPPHTCPPPHLPTTCHQPHLSPPTSHLPPSQLHHLPPTPPPTSHLPPPPCPTTASVNADRASGRQDVRQRHCADQVGASDTASPSGGGPRLGSQDTKGAEGNLGDSSSQCQGSRSVRRLSVPALAAPGISPTFGAGAGARPVLRVSNNGQRAAQVLYKSQAGSNLPQVGYRQHSLPLRQKSCSSLLARVQPLSCPKAFKPTAPQSPNPRSWGSDPLVAGTDEHGQHDEASLSSCGSGSDSDDEPSGVNGMERSEGRSMLAAAATDSQVAARAAGPPTRRHSCMLTNLLKLSPGLSDGRATGGRRPSLGGQRSADGTASSPHTTTSGSASPASAASPLSPLSPLMSNMQGCSLPRLHGPGLSRSGSGSLILTERDAQQSSILNGRGGGGGSEKWPKSPTALSHISSRLQQQMQSNLGLAPPGSPTKAAADAAAAEQEAAHSEPTTSLLDLPSLRERVYSRASSLARTLSNRQRSTSFSQPHASEEPDARADPSAASGLLSKAGSFLPRPMPPSNATAPEYFTAAAIAAGYVHGRPGGIKRCWGCLGHWGYLG